MSVCLITPTEYLAMQLREQEPLRQVYSWRNFCEKWLQDLNITFLSPLVERLTWYEQTRDLEFNHKEALTTELMNADHVMQLYKIAPAQLLYFDADTVILFRQVLTEFEAKLAETGQTTFLRGLKNLQEAVLPLSFQNKLFEFTGFIDFPPLYIHIVENINRQAVKVTASTPVASFVKIAARIYEAANIMDEFETALNCIEQEWRQDPDKKFMLVIDPSELTWQAIHLFLQSRRSPLNISYSKERALTEQPHFLFLQDFFESFKTRDLLQLSRVLTAPFWPDDLVRRLQLDRLIRKKLLRTTTLPDLLRYLLTIDVDIQSTRWFQTWLKFSNFNESHVEFFHNLFMQATAVMTLPRKKTANVSLHIVSLLEAAAFPVDKVWIMSADSNHFPLKKIWPMFLPKPLLIAAGVPLSLEKSEQYSKNLLQAISHEKEVFASFIKVVGGAERKLSRLLEAAEYYQPIREQSVALSSPPVPVYISNPIPLPTQISPVMKGGAMLLKEQAECPFKAFAHFRLEAHALEAGREIIDPAQKGILVHAVLEKIWHTLQSQQNLLDLDEEARAALIKEKVEAVLWQAHVPGRKLLLKKLEKYRLVSLLKSWLSLEASRPPFRIMATEKQEIITLSGLQLRLRIDRIDSVGTGQLIIDYKTGEASTKGWFDIRLREPQLPLYLIGNSATGIAYAGLKINKMGFTGIVENIDDTFAEVGVLPDKTWQAQQHIWKTQLEQLAAEFQQGQHDVAPIDEKACLYCDLSRFCRIKEHDANFMFKKSIAK